MKRAFSLVEIGFVIFIIMAVFFTVIPFSVANIKQVRYIAEWKDYIEQAEYSFETLKEYKKTTLLDNKNSVERLLLYLDAKKLSAIREPALKRYKYKMMNGNLYEKMTLSKFDETYIDVKKRLIGIEENPSCNEINPCATVWVDLNGIKRPNVVGKDIFIYEVYPDYIQQIQFNAVNLQKGFLVKRGMELFEFAPEVRKIKPAEGCLIVEKLCIFEHFICFLYGRLIYRT